MINIGWLAAGSVGLVFATCRDDGLEWLIMMVNDDW